MTLRKLTQTDVLPMLELLTDETIKQTYMLPDFDKTEDALPLFCRLVQLSQDSSHFVRGICPGDTLIGFLNDVEIQNGTIEVGYVIHPAYWNRGYATAALKEAISQLFALGYEEVTAGAFCENPASTRVMKKAGMTLQEKTDQIEYRGRSHTCIYYSITQAAIL